MDERRKNAYRHLLYLGLLHISPLACPKRFQGWRILNPFYWGRCFRQVRFAGHLADWLQDVASFSARDFEGFDEALFWQEFEYFPSNYPDYQPERYRLAFEEHLRGN